LKGFVRLSGGLKQSQLNVDFTRSGSSQALRLASQTYSASTKSTASEPEEREVSLDLPSIGEGVISATLSDDANLADHHLSFVTHVQPKPFEILILGEAKADLLQTLQALDGAHIEHLPRLPKDQAKYDLIIAIDVVLDAPIATNLLLIGQSRLAEEAKPDFVEPGEVTFWQSHHALSQGLAWTNLTIKRAFKFAPWADGDSILSAGETNLISARSTPFGRQIRIAFDPRAEWNKQTSFAQFIGNLRLWIGPFSLGRIDQPCLAGSLCPLDARWHKGHLQRIIDPRSAADTQAHTLDLPNPGQDFRPSVSGLYKWSEGQPTDLIAINPNLTPKATKALAQTPLPNIQSERQPIWPYVLSLIALLMIVEFYVSHRNRRVSPSSAISRLAILGCVTASLFHLPAPKWDERQSKVILIGAEDEAKAALPSPDQGEAIVLYANADRITQDKNALTRSMNALGLAQPISSADALAYARALLPPFRKGEIELRGELNFNTSDMADLAPLLQARSLTLTAHTKPSNTQTILRDLTAPQSLFAGESFTLTARVKSPVAQSAHLILSEDSTPILEQDVELIAGENPIETVIPHAKEGRAFYSLALTPNGQSTAAPLSSGLFVQGRLAPRILILGTGPTTKDFADRLNDKGLQTKIMVPTGAPWLIEDWLACDGYVFMDVPAIALNSTQQNLLVEAVGRHARPLLLLGGPHAFGPGGYLETPLDQLSPVSSRVPKPSPEASVAFVIDRSGSMAQAVGDSDRLQIAKQATLTAIAQLNPQSKVSVIAFDTEARLIAPLQPVSQIDALTRSLTQMIPGGGTDLYPALQMALGQMRDAESSIKHVIVFTDGLTPPAPFDELVGEMTKAGMTISTVSIGTWAGDVELRAIAKKGGGAFHSTNDFKALPSIMAQEAMLMSDSAVEERTTVPRWSSTRPAFLSPLPDQLPAIKGYVLTSTKPDAEVSLSVTTEDGGEAPLLASWHYGSGRVLALTTQAIGDWTQNWQSLPDYQNLWSHVLPHFLTGADSTGLNLIAQMDSQGLFVQAHALDKMRAYQQGLILKAHIKPLGSSAAEALYQLPLIETRPGQYEGRIPHLPFGDYDITLANGEQSQTLSIHHTKRQVESEETTRTLQALTQATRPNADLHSAPASSRFIWQADWRLWALLAYLIFASEILIGYGLLDNLRKRRLR
ncbi:MAG: VWA domain-containing protein, partial [Alphaproteobacteria bacterium]|nr:VWA domain-containing protein [Alphaproteobacteria bacterium]